MAAPATFPAKSDRDRTSPVFSQRPGSRCVTYGLTMTSASAGIRYPPITSSFTASGRKPRRRINPHRLRDYAVDVVESGQIFETRRPAFQRRIHFQFNRFPYLGVLGYEVPRPGNSIGDGIVPCLEHRHQFIANLAIGHRLPGLLIARPEKQRHQVTVVDLISPSLLDNAKNEVIQRTDGALEAMVLSKAKPRQQFDYLHCANQVHVSRAIENGIA